MRSRRAAFILGPGRQHFLNLPRFAHARHERRDMLASDLEAFLRIPAKMTVDSDDGDRARTCGCVVFKFYPSRSR